VNQESKILLIDLYDSSLNEHREPRFSDLWVRMTEIYM
jgi:hypothetical protein